jgi:hypothetical protein
LNGITAVLPRGQLALRRELPGRLGAAEKRSRWGRCAQRTSSTDSPRLSERSVHRTRSEFRGATPTVSIAGLLCRRQRQAAGAWVAHASRSVVNNVDPAAPPPLILNTA